MSYNLKNPAPGGPGNPARWTSSAKTGVGTALSNKSHVWFTLSHGIFNEIYYPRIDQACVRDMGLIVTDGADFFSEEKRGADSEVHWLADGVPAFRLVNTCRDGRYRIEKQIVTDPHRDTVLQQVQFIAQQGARSGYHLHVLLAPHLGNHGSGNKLAAGRVENAKRLLAALESFANEGGLISEQVWDAPDIPERELYFGRPSGSAMPLVWAHAEYLKLRRSLRDGRPFDLPPQTVQRYLTEKTVSPRLVWRFNHKIRSMPAGKILRIETMAPAVIHWSADDWNTAQDVTAHDVGLGIHIADLSTQALPKGKAAAAFVGQPGGNGAESVRVGAGVFASAIVRQPGMDRGGQPHGIRRFIRRGTGAGFLADAVGDLPVAHPRSGHERRDGRQLERQLDRGLVVFDAHASPG
jgi:hypothetical protein